MTKDKDKDNKNAKSKGKERWMTKGRVLSDMLTLGHKSGRGAEPAKYLNDQTYTA